MLFLKKNEVFMNGIEKSNRRVEISVVLSDSFLVLKTSQLKEFEKLNKIQEQQFQTIQKKFE